MFEEPLFTKESPRVKIEVISKEGFPDNLKNRGRYRPGYYRVKYTFKTRQHIDRLGPSQFIDVIVPWAANSRGVQARNVIFRKPEENIIDALHRIILEDDRPWKDFMVLTFRSLVTQKERGRAVRLVRCSK